MARQAVVLWVLAVMIGLALTAVKEAEALEFGKTRDEIMAEVRVKQAEKELKDAKEAADAVKDTEAVTAEDGTEVAAGFYGGEAAVYEDADGTKHRMMSGGKFKPVECFVGGRLFERRHEETIKNYCEPHGYGERVAEDGSWVRSTFWRDAADDVDHAERDYVAEAKAEMVAAAQEEAAEKVREKANKEAAEATIKTPAEWFSDQTDDYRYAHMDERPAADPGMAWAEDGTQVPADYWDAPTVTAEDGSEVPESFYDRTDYNRNGVTDQDEGFPPRVSPEEVIAAS